MVRLGKREAQPSDQDFRYALLREAVDIAWPLIPTRFGHGLLFHGEWGMYGNGPDPTVAPGFEGCGDCVLAGADHEHRLAHKVIKGTDLPFSGATAVADYSAVTGYVVGDDATDQGTYVKDAMSYRRKVGVVDGLGNRHRIGAYVSVDPKDWGQLLEAIYIFGAVGIGFQFPASAWNQFDSGGPWDAVANDGGIEGGHYVPCVGTTRHDHVTVITWGERFIMTQAFYEKYNDESWVPINLDALRKDNTSYHGFNIEQLNAWLAALN